MLGCLRSRHNAVLDALGRNKNKGILRPRFLASVWNNRVTGSRAFNHQSTVSPVPLSHNALKEGGMLDGSSDTPFLFTGQ